MHEIRTAIEPVWDWCQEALDYMALSSAEPWKSSAKGQKIEVDVEELVRRATAADAQSKGVDATALEQDIVREARERVVYHKWAKIRADLEWRKQFVRARPESITPTNTLYAESQSGQSKGWWTPSPAMDKRVSDVNAMMRTMLSEAGLEPDAGIARDGERGTETAEIPFAYWDKRDRLGQHYGDADAQLEYRVQNVQLAPPSFQATRTLLPHFRQVVYSRMPDWY